MPGKFLALLLFALVVVEGYAADYDLVINHGRVMDPETSLDAVRHLAIEEGRICLLYTSDAADDTSEV